MKQNVLIVSNTSIKTKSTNDNANISNIQRKFNCFLDFYTYNILQHYFKTKISVGDSITYEFGNPIKLKTNSIDCIDQKVETKIEMDNSNGIFIMYIIQVYYVVFWLILCQYFRLGIIV